MYINTEQLTKRLNGPSNLQVEIHKENRGRKAGESNKPELTDAEKVLIGVLAKQDLQTTVAESFGISQPEVSNLSRGIEGTGNRKHFNPDLKNEIDSVHKVQTDSIAELAAARLAQALGIVGNTMETVKSPREAAAIAKDMSTIHRNLNPNKDAGNTVSNNVLVIHAPARKESKNYEVIEA